MKDERPTLVVDGQSMTDDAEATIVLAYIRTCADSWDGSARIIGDARARDISRVCSVAIEALARPVPSTSVNPSNPDRGEPVAYRWRYSFDSRICVNVTLERPDHPDAIEVTPLYSHPTVSAEREALEKALDDKAISDGFDDWSWNKKGDPVGCMLPHIAARVAFFAGAKFARAALSSTDGRSSAGCVCQDQHRKGYCTEAGCPNALRSAGQSDNKLWLFLSILKAAGGETSGNDDKWNWINYFCDDAEPLDTFNQASKQKLTRVTHDSDSDNSVVYLTEAGRQYIATAAPHIPVGSED